MLCAAASVLAVAISTSAIAQESADADTGRLTEIVVTAQKREQSLQDVPIAVTAVTQEALQANRITTVNDLGSIAPGVTVRPSAGGIQTPFFTIRGQQSAGVVAGSDKQASIYLDGVYLASPRGTIFDMPDVARLEVLRGPQGTLFGRNATAGAISVVTRDPTGEGRVKLEGTYGNLDAYRVRATIETPEFGPFSAYFSYVRNYRRGSIRNLAAGVVWNRNAVGYGTATSPEWLGTTDTNSYFAAVKFEPTDTFKMIYKFDRNDDTGTPEGTGLVAISNALRPFILASGVPIAPSATRPDAVSNGFVVPRQQRVFGHSLTATWKATDSITVKNILAYRKADVYSPSSIEGFGGIVLTAANAPYLGLPSSFIGQRFVGYVSQATSIASQWSDELQVNYGSERLQLTVGALWFHSKEESGGPPGQQNSPAGAFFPANGTIPLANEGRSFNKATSLAAYAQAEFKILPELELVGGIRVTHDKKESALRFDILTQALQVPTTTIAPPDYKKTKPSYLLGLNWRPARDALVYFKYSNSFVSGGTTYGINYEPEIATSFELGAKVDFLDKRLRTNIAVYTVDYKNLQQSQSPRAAASSRALCTNGLIPLYGATLGAGLCDNAIGTFIAQIGTLRARGVELEVTAAPTRGVTLGGSLAYTNTKFVKILPEVLAANLGSYLPTYRPKWTGTVFASAETKPLWGDVTAQVRMDALYQSRLQIDNHSPQVYALITAPGSTNAYANPAYWLLNGRAALKHLKIGPVEGEIAVWGKNLTNRKDMQFSLALGPSLSTSANYIPARTYGIDLSIDF